MTNDEKRQKASLHSSFVISAGVPGGPDMEFRRVRALRGPNVWARVPVLEAWVELGEQDGQSDRFPGLAERLLGWLPSLAEHRPDFVAGLRRGTDLGDLLAQIGLGLQALAGTPAGFARSE